MKILTDGLAYLPKSAMEGIFRYVIIVGLVHLLVLGMRVVWGQRFKVRRESPPLRQVGQEAFNSIIATAVFAAVAVVVYIIVESFLPQVRHWRGLEDQTLAPRGLVVALSVILLVLLQDAYFYWTHRLMHDRRWFRVVHAEHHKSHNPSPWAAYSFSIPEALIQGLFFAVALITLPLPGEAKIIFITFAIVFDALGHSGVEFLPRWVVTHPNFGWLTGATYHDLHHARGRSHYGLYLRFWDRLMGTEEPNFAAIYEHVCSKSNDGDAYRRLLSPSRAPLVDPMPMAQPSSHSL
jgi:sterol desaturase/sphingolipid hydroxylase (fatty acid hydroxylase superfamily)